MFAALSPIAPFRLVHLSTATLLALCSTACVRAYRPPTPDEPHSVLKLRRTYETQAGTHLNEEVNLGDERGYHDTGDAQVASVSKSDAILIHPVPVAVTVESSFTHLYTHQVLEHYTEQEPYQATETYSCGTGTSYRSCSRSTTRYRSVPKTRMVTRTDTVVDGTCQRSIDLNPQQGSTYLLQYTYQDDKLCSLSCFEQASTPAGELKQIPCRR